MSEIVKDFKESIKYVGELLYGKKFWWIEYVVWGGSFVICLIFCSYIIR